jgi:hypothetical protein
MATLTNPAAEIATLSSRYAAVAGRTSTVRADSIRRATLLSLLYGL